MRLTLPECFEYLRFWRPDQDAPTVKQRETALLDRITRGEATLDDRFLARDSGTGQITAVAQLVHEHAATYHLNLRGRSAPASAWTVILADTTSRLRDLGAARAMLRIVTNWSGLPAEAGDAEHRAMASVIGGADPPQAPEEAARAGFTLRSERIEYYAPVRTLPTPQGAHLRWEPLADLSERSIEGAATLVTRCAPGDPDWDPRDDASEVLQGYFNERSLTSDPACLQLGYLEDAREPCAFVVAQTERDTGWGRLAYLGLLPEYRRRALGAEIHRHGFAMLRDQGAVAYHGGTLATNLPMTRLFVRSGCRELRRIEEWILELPAVSG